MSARRPISLALLLIVSVACAGCKGVTIGSDNKYGDARAVAMVSVPLDKVAHDAFRAFVEGKTVG